MYNEKWGGLPSAEFLASLDPKLGELRRDRLYAKAYSSEDQKPADIPGLCGIVDGSILPGYFGLEAGQSADMFNWFVGKCVPADIFARPMKISKSGQTCALGAAIFGAVVGGVYEKTEDAQEKMCGLKKTVYEPKPENQSTKAV